MKDAYQILRLQYAFDGAEQSLFRSCSLGKRISSWLTAATPVPWRFWRNRFAAAAQPLRRSPSWS